MPTTIESIGTNAAATPRNALGVPNARVSLTASTPAFVDINGKLKNVPLLQTPHTADATTVTAGSTLDLTAIDPTHYFVVFGIVISISVAGKAQLLFGSTPIANLVLLANTPLVIPLPLGGMQSLVAGDQLVFKNTQGVSVDVTYTVFGEELGS